MTELPGLVGGSVHDVSMAAAGQTRTRQLLKGRLLPYVGGNVSAAALFRLAEEMPGFVLRGSRGARLGRNLRRTGYEGSLLLDPACYETNELARPGDWIDEQRACRVSVYLSPSLFIPFGDREALLAAIRAGDRFLSDVRAKGIEEPVRTVIALDARWLRVRPDDVLEALRMSLSAPALVLADRNNPLETRAAIDGLLLLLAEVQDLLLLRSDVATLGALAHGAAVGAIGTGTSVRHLVPPGTSGGGTRGDPTPRALVPSFLDYRTGAKLGQLESVRHLLDCYCRVCLGQSLLRFDDPLRREEALLHSIHSALSIAEKLMEFEESSRPGIWARMCEAAIGAVDDAAEQSHTPLEPQPYLRAWAARGGARR